MILVVGATGNLGLHVCKLLGSVEPTRALVRTNSEPKHGLLRAANCELKLGDLREPDSLAAACQGVDTVISTASSTQSQVPGDTIESVDHDGQLALVEAAERAGASTFIFISLLKQDEKFALQDAKRAVETRLGSSSKLRVAVLQPTFFADVWLSPPLGFDVKGKEPSARLYGDGTTPTAWICCEDVAEAAIHAARTPSCRGIFEVGGPEAVTQNALVDAAEKLVGRSVKRDPFLLESLSAQYKSSTEPRQRSFFALAMQLARGQTPDPRRSLPGWQPRISVYQYLQRNLAD